MKMDCFWIKTFAGWVAMFGSTKSTFRIPFLNPKFGPKKLTCWIQHSPPRSNLWIQNLDLGGGFLDPKIGILIYECSNNINNILVL